jgi:gluconate 2-dehydrogenase gamma chain
MKDRREFIKIASAGVGSLILTSGCSKGGEKWRFFTDEEAPVVEAITEQIIPTDEDAGAREASVINFIDKQLTGFLSKHQQTYRRGIAGTQQTSVIKFGKKFELLDWNQQKEVLKNLEAGDAQGDIWKTDSASMFFRLIRNHTMQGFYGSPRHGGNRRFVSFKMLQIDYPRIYGQNRYKKFPGTFKPHK